jgi:uncharacterized protein YyaL (SSP411 family)
MNHLKNEKSPYLKQHATNPVDWYPWGEEAFKKAKQENKPIFLSIGYSTCHWCHVMEHESFEDQKVADILNRHFVSIKVDREERPDIDSVYMMVCQMMTGHGGWPLTVFLTPDLKPFFAGTYFPKESKYGRLGMVDLLPRVADIFMNKKSELDQTVEGIQAAIQELQNSKSIGVQEFDLEELVRRSKDELFQMFDSENGGFGVKPKFPSPHKIIFLLENYRLSKDQDALEIAEKTLLKMFQGGIFDHVGGGFHRYSTDEMWRLPHFEKMLYDQAWMSYAYTVGYELTQNSLYKTAAAKTFDFVLQELTDPQGGFYSAFDADSEGEEGKFYTWSVEELKKSLTENEYSFLEKHFDLQPDGNFYDEATQEKNGQNIFYLKEITQDFLVEFESISKKLFNLRSKRIKPLRDEKILTDWNSMMTASFLKAAKVFKNDRYKEAGLKNIQFIIDELKLNEHLFHRICEGELQKFEFLDDQAAFIWALMHAYELTADKKYLQISREHINKIETQFKDSECGGYFQSPQSQEVVLTRMKDLYDGAQPSANSIYLTSLTKLTLYMKDPSLQEKYEENLKKIYDQVAHAPSSHAFLAVSCLFFLHPYCEEGLC